MRHSCRKDTAAREKAESLYFEAAQPLLQQEKFAEAIDILADRRARALKNSAQLELALGVAYYGLRRFDEAAGAFLRTIAIAPNIARPYVFLGKFLDQIPDRLPEVTNMFARYEQPTPKARRLPAPRKSAERPGESSRKPRGHCSKGDRDRPARCRGAFRTGRHVRPPAALRGIGSRISAGGRTGPRRFGRPLPPLPSLRPAGPARRRPAERDLHAKLVQAEEAARQ